MTHNSSRMQIAAPQVHCTITQAMQRLQVARLNATFRTTPRCKQQALTWLHKTLQAQRRSVSLCCTHAAFTRTDFTLHSGTMPLAHCGYGHPCSNPSWRNAKRASWKQLGFLLNALNRTLFV
jgi:hypothetical protein